MRFSALFKTEPDAVGFIIQFLSSLRDKLITKKNTNVVHINPQHELKPLSHTFFRNNFSNNKTDLILTFIVNHF